MNKKLLETLADKCKDMGLSEKAIGELATIASDGLTDESSDEQIQAKADSLVPIARAMQGEVTRKMQRKEKPTDARPDTDNNGQNGDQMPTWFKVYSEQMNTKIETLQAENKQAKADEAQALRQAAINAKAQELGIPDYLMKRFRISDNEDIEKELTDFKQDLVTNRLMPAETGTEKPDMSRATREYADSIVQRMNI
ncbi:hypothetical protein D0T49_12100 [Paludibacter sp. 221]|uniref:hypothetical protein n=1 Tax=Paludibacter sp. 221 TaxID=2302939 RepID=UPI0013D66CE8|nr:hypothetical protein [Paludibacter sp. 221]NDV47788.1 hypothetical protein [Paludibacter sp. 221]